MKGVIQPDHIPVNKYLLIFLGLPVLTPVEVSGLEEEIQESELPDRTVASGGDSGPSEFEIMIPAHHAVEQAAMEIWFREGKEPVSPGYKKNGSLIMQSISGEKFRSFSLVGAWAKKRALPDLELANEGEMASITWTIRVDQILPI